MRWLHRQSQTEYLNFTNRIQRCHKQRCTQTNYLNKKRVFHWYFHSFLCVQLAICTRDIKSLGSSSQVIVSEKTEGVAGIWENKLFWHSHPEKNSFVTWVSSNRKKWGTSRRMGYRNVVSFSSPVNSRVSNWSHRMNGKLKASESQKSSSLESNWFLMKLATKNPMTRKGVVQQQFWYNLLLTVKQKTSASFATFYIQALSAPCSWSAALGLKLV